MCNRFAFACALVLLAGLAPDEIRKGMPPVPGKQRPDADLPTRLTLSIGGGIFPPNYGVVLDGKSLTYRVQTYDYAASKAAETSKTITPTPEQWRGFWKSMDEVGLWDWRPRYDDSRIFDGTFWSVEADHAGRSVRSQGRQLFPGQETIPGPGEIRRDRGPLFEKYLAAVEKLLGGEPFR